MRTAVKIAIVESEAGYGRRVDDWMVCLSSADALAYQQEFNSKLAAGQRQQDRSAQAEAWAIEHALDCELFKVEVNKYSLQVEGSAELIDMTPAQYKKLEKAKRMYWSQLRNL